MDKQINSHDEQFKSDLKYLLDKYDYMLIAGSYDRADGITVHYEYYRQDNNMRLTIQSSWINESFLLRSTGPS